MHAGRVVYLGQECGIAWKPKGTAMGRGGEAKAKCRQNFSVETSVAVGEKIVTFWTEAAVAPLCRPPRL